MPRIPSGMVDRHLGERLRSLRLRDSLSQTELGQRVGISFQQVQKYERGASRISASLLFRLAELFDVETSYFYRGLPVSSGPAAVKPAASLQAPAESARVDPQNAMEFACTAEGLALIGAFTNVKSARIRQHLIDLIQTAAEAC